MARALAMLPACILFALGAVPVSGDTGLAVRLVHFVNVCTAAIVAGGLWQVHKIIAAGINEFPPGLGIRVHQLMLDKTPDRHMLPSGATAAVTALVLLVLQPDITRLSTIFVFIGLLGNLAVIIASRYFNVKTNAMVRHWPTDPAPPEWPETRRRWDKVNTVRVAGATTMFLFYSLAGIEPLRVLPFINVIAVGILAGGAAMTHRVIVPQKGILPQHDMLIVHQSMFDTIKDAYMRPTGVTAGLTAILCMIFEPKPAAAWVTIALYVLGLGGVLINVVMGNRFLVPINRKIAKWSVDDPPADCPEIMRRYERATAARFVGALVSLVCFILVAVVLRPAPASAASTGQPARVRADKPLTPEGSPRLQTPFFS